MNTHKFRKLNVWQRSIKFVSLIYEITATFPKEEKYGLIDQIRRAAVSISLNIAEGSGAGSDAEFSRFLRMSQRSAYEVIAALEIAINLKNDELIDVLLTDGNKEIIIGTSNGIASRFRERDVRVTGRNASGVRGIRLEENDEVVGLTIANENETLLTITEDGFGKRTEINIKYIKENAWRKIHL